MYSRALYADVLYIMDIMDIFKHKHKIILIAAFFSAASIFSQTEATTPQREKFVSYSKQFLGTKYQRGATGPDAFDCSGFVYTMSRESVGVQLPRTSQAMYTYAVLIPESDREIGDLVFFRTTNSGNVSHVGILISEDTFIHCASDGPTTGVITSSLKSGYWKQHYIGTGRVLEPAQKKKITVNPLPASEKKSESTESAAKTPAAQQNVQQKNAKAATAENRTVTKTSASTKPKSTSKTSDFTADFSLCMDWSVLTAKDFILNFRGISSSANIRYTAWELEPGLGVMFRYDNRMGIVQFPVVVSLTFSEYVRAYAGPVITFGTPEVPADSEHEAKGSVFPGIIGLSFSTPSWNAGAVKIALIQDIQYTVFNETDNSALSARNSAASGILLSTGVRVSLPL